MNRIQVLTKLHQVAPNCTKLHQSLPSCTNLHQVTPNCTKLTKVYHVVPECTKLHQSAPDDFPWFWSKIGHLSMFFFSRQYRLGKCVLRYCRTKKAFVGYKNNSVEHDIMSLQPSKIQNNLSKKERTALTNFRRLVASTSSLKSTKKATPDVLSFLAMATLQSEFLNL